MTRSRLVFAGVLVLAVVAGGYVAYDQVLSGDSVAPLALPSTSPDPTPSSAAPSDASGPSAEPTTSAGGEIAGTWVVASGSQAGYRVRERLASLSARATRSDERLTSPGASPSNRAARPRPSLPGR